MICGIRKSISNIEEAMSGLMRGVAVAKATDLKILFIKIIYSFIQIQDADVRYYPLQFSEMRIGSVTHVVVVKSNFGIK